MIELVERGPFVSVIIPTWCEVDCIADVVARARAIGDEVIVADADSDDGTAAAARAAGAIIVRSVKGRGPQLNAGAAIARGEVLLFLHADTQLEARARDAIRSAVTDPSVVGGNFYLRFEGAGRWARFFTTVNDVRRRWLRIYYGDSAIFVRRSAYEKLGGFPSIPLFEDYALVRLLEREGHTAYIRDVVIVASARRFERAPMKTLFVWIVLQALYMTGVSPHRLARLYAAGDGRRS